MRLGSSPKHKHQSNDQAKLRRKRNMRRKRRKGEKTRKEEDGEHFEHELLSNFQQAYISMSFQRNFHNTSKETQQWVELKPYKSHSQSVRPSCSSHSSDELPCVLPIPCTCIDTRRALWLPLQVQSYWLRTTRDTGSKASLTLIFQEKQKTAKA